MLYALVVPAMLCSLLKRLAVNGKCAPLSDGHGFRVGRRMISLIKLFGSWVTIARTACAISSGRNILSRALPVVSAGEKRVSVEPGQIRDTRIPYSRTSSARDSVHPTTPNFEAQ